ncbi:MAG TPA: hypothetical protein VN714_15945 [Trebonia sp.]|nr:hypothetical protein [Trebonia sp.]
MGALVLGFIIAVSSFLASVQERRLAQFARFDLPGGAAGAPEAV